MKRTLLALLLLSFARAGYAGGLESSRQEAGLKYGDTQFKSSVAEAVNMSGYTFSQAKTIDPASLQASEKTKTKAPPPLKDLKTGANKSAHNPLTDPHVIAGSLVAVGTVVLVAVISPAAVPVVAGGMVVAGIMACIMAD